MAKLQLLAITTLDGYLFDRTVSSPLWDNPNKYGLTKIRERATQTLGPDVSFNLIDTMEKEKWRYLFHRSGSGHNFRYKQHVQILVGG